MGPRGITNLGLQRIVFMDTLLRYPGFTVLVLLT